MKRVFKWLLIIVSCLIAILIAIILIASSFVDVQKYRPEIEELVSEATGRPFAIGGDLGLSIFPWISISADDVHLGNPPGFEEKDFLSVASFEMRVKAVPLILSRFKDIQVKPFILRGVRIVLETRKDGTTNLEGIGESAAEKSHGRKTDKEKPSWDKPEIGLPIIDEFAVTDSSLVWIDHTTEKRFEVSDLSLKIQEVSLDRAIHIVFSALVDGRPLSLEGDIGPLGKEWRQGAVPVDLSINTLKHLDVKLKGNVIDAASSPKYDLSVVTSPFSPRKLFATMGQEFPIVTADPKALTRLALTADVKGDTGNVSVSDGVVHLDESKLHFSGKAGDFSRPDVTFDLKLDEIDLDRYLAPGPGEESEQGNEKARSQGLKAKKTEKLAPGKQKADYNPLRQLVLNGTIVIGKLKVADVRIQDFNLKITGKNGVFKFEPLRSDLYQGAMTLEGSLNLRKDVPESNIRIQAKGVNAGPLLIDLADKDLLEGGLNAEMTISFKGDSADKIKKSLNGDGNLFLEKGAVKGIDLVAMVRNTDGAYGFASKDKASRRTEFDAFKVPFYLKDGILYTDQAEMVSTLLRVHTTGKADLVNQILNFRIEPTFVTTRKKDVEKMKRSEVVVPILVTGNFSDPKFRPDVKAVAEKKLEEKVFESSKFKEIFEKEELKPYEENAKDLLKGFLDMAIPDEEKSKAGDVGKKK